MISIIMPAHNEEAVIARGLRAITTGARLGELEVIVVCNGCTDRTAGIASSFGSPVRVIEVEIASKTEALNAGDAAAEGFPRLYVDADVRLDIGAVRELAAVLERDGALLASPVLRMDLRDTACLVRTYYRVWMALPYNRVMVGTGVYGLSAAGRLRFSSFPRVIADDGFVRFHFAPHERQCVAAAKVWVDPPKTLMDLLRIKTRSRLGQRQMRSLYPRLGGSDAKQWIALAKFLLRNPRLWLDIPIYLALCLCIWGRACLASRRGHFVWERDNSTRINKVGAIE